MLAGHHVLGGEQSGHIILAEHATTGDGVLTGLQLLAVLARRGVSLAEAAKVMTRYPQVLINVPGDKSRAASSPHLAEAVASATEELGQSGRILVRPSGTERAVRVMVEAVEVAQAESVARRVADAVRLALTVLARGATPRSPPRRPAHGAHRGTGHSPGHKARTRWAGNDRLSVARVRWTSTTAWQA
jgi:phosphomannomutase